uniref:Hydrophobic seed protein domain-containing protein n=1 Tax=Oryza punctata TaxID=4537 RepID=A0A0E0LM73_ORYPU
MATKHTSNSTMFFVIVLLILGSAVNGKEPPNPCLAPAPAPAKPPPTIAPIKPPPTIAPTKPPTKPPPTIAPAIPPSTIAPAKPPSTVAPTKPPTIAPAKPPTNVPPTITPVSPPSSSLPPSVNPPKPKPLPKCPRLLTNLGGCISLGIGNSLMKYPCCSQLSNLQYNTAAACLCDAMKIDLRINLDINVMIDKILKLCGKVGESTVLCVP